jgi:ankyrin repeat protein
MDAYLSRRAWYLAAQSWQIALLVAAVAVVTFALRHRSAHIRYLLWLIVIAKCLVPPLHVVPLRILPPVRGEIHSVSPLPAQSIQPSIIPSPTSFQASSAQLPESSTPPPALPTGVRRLSASGWLGVAWIAGVGAYLLMNLLRAVRGHYWLRKTRKSLPDDVQADMATLLRDYGVRRSPRIWIMAGVGQPFVWGLPRGSIYVPPAFLAIESPEQRRDILAHELSHVIRLDAGVNTLQVIAQGLFWFHPFVWWANHKIRREREKCCDEMVIAHLGARPKDYGAAIVNTLIPAQESVRAVPSLAIAGPVKNIEERIRAMLRPGKRFYTRPSLIAATMVLLAALLTVPTALVLTARAQTEAPKLQAKSAYPLHEAALAGDMEKVKSLLAKGADVNERGRWGYTPLHYASMKGHAEVAKLLISKGAYVNAVSESYFGQPRLPEMTPLHCAAACGNRQTVELLLGKSADINAKDRKGRTPLFEAMKSTAAGRKEVVELLLAKGAKIPALHLAAYMGDMGKVKECLQDGTDIDSQKDAGCTALHAAANGGHKDVVEFLIGKGANVDAKDGSGLTPLYYAATHNREDIADLLLAKGADVNAQHEYGFALLHYAIAQDDSKDAVKLLISKGANVNVGDWDGFTPLNWATWRSDKDVVQLLIDKGADVNQEDKWCGCTVLHWAAMGGHKDAVELLIAKGAAPLSAIHSAVRDGDLAKVESLVEQGADVNTRAKSSGGWTPLFAAVCADQNDVHVAKFLIAKGADVNAKEKSGMTALHVACEDAKRNMAELLIAKGADVDAKDGGGCTPLHRMFYSGCNGLDVAGLLIAKGANVNAKLTDAGLRGELTPLHFAVESGHTKIVGLFIDKGADINAPTTDGQTPLHIACECGHQDVVELLVAKRADVNAKDNKGRSALSLAKEQGHDEIVKLLLQHGAKE